MAAMGEVRPRGKRPREVVAWSPSQTSWDPELSSEAGRQFLQKRLATFTATIFSLYVGVSVIVIAFFELTPRMKPSQYAVAVFGAMVGAALLAAIWAATRSKRMFPARALHAMDLGVLLALGIVGALIAYTTSDRGLNGYLTLTIYSFVIVGRALFVPSTRRRTLLLSALGMLPVAVSYTTIALEQPGHLPVGAGAWLVGTAIIIGVTVLLAAIGSGVIYGLRREVEEARELGQYTLGEKLGQGGMGVVYKASHRMLRRPTAIKLLRPEIVNELSLQRFEREVQLTSQLTHPNTIAIFDYGRGPDGTFYYAMEYLDGIDLERLVGKYGPLPAARVVHLLRQVCGALNEAHGRGLIHRDIKPANIIVCMRGDVADVVKVVDFGLVKDVSAAGDARVTAQQAVAGTPAYLSPEAITTPDEIGPACDLYAVGAVAYFLLTGQLVFEGNAVEVYGHHVVTPPQPPRSRSDNPISAELEEVVLHCLAKRPTERPDSAQKLAENLAAVPEADRWTAMDAKAWWGANALMGSGPSLAAAEERKLLTVDLRDRTR